MKWKDEIVEEVRTAREAYAAQFDYDLARMFEDLKKKRSKIPRPVLISSRYSRTAVAFDRCNAVDTTSRLFRRLFLRWERHSQKPPEKAAAAKNGWPHMPRQYQIFMTQSN